ncbi:N-acetyltransferase [Lentzea sp. NBRC 105346]|uniref:GNAT family N-acetyltransferase n=1 Tax=Lentzea sp. NBRC 105346 TaxID=3032205 RepID=UPI00249FEB38|nr:GNAT family N-acetyltransferase [Lentzea sp. NBRC 105346]GLZ28855.1 N-acetyltransferase [Lentzea sp. NBRC 105346]
MKIREFTESDWDQTWPILRDVIRAGDTFTYEPGMSEREAHDIWVERPPGLTVVATRNDRVQGTAKMGPNRAGPGAHVATASFMVAADARGLGVGTKLCAFALDWARTQGFAGMQFNAVAESNTTATAIYQRLGFEIVGTVPGAFAHPQKGRTGLYVMYRALESRS